LIVAILKSINFSGENPHTIVPHERPFGAAECFW
jgi:hypothetical protein